MTPKREPPKRNPPEKELRLAVVMSGGVSLAIWMGGVTHNLLRLVETPGYFGLPEDVYLPSIDVIAGTSAGGLNGVFLAAARAWGIGADQFRREVQETWLELGSMERLLRSPLAPDPPSLFDGDRSIYEGVRNLLEGWLDQAPKPLPAEAEDFRIHLTVTTTLLTPHLNAFHDDLGMKIVEPSNAGTFTFTKEHFTQRTKIVRWLAEAARASASFPVAFEPRFVSVGPNESQIPPEIVNFSGSRYAADGGLIVNRPFRHALKGIIEQSADWEVERWLVYIVPDPDPVGSSPVPETADKPYSLTTALGKVATAGFSQSLTEDLSEWQRHRSAVESQQENRYWLATLSEADRAALATSLYDMFRTRRAESSVRGTLRSVLERSTDRSIPWKEVETALMKARCDRKTDWHPKKWPAKTPGIELWAWGLSSLEYFAQIALDLIRQSWDAATDKAALSDLRNRVHEVLKALRAYRTLDRLYWDRRLDVLSKQIAGGVEDVEGTVTDWARDAYRQWPFIKRHDDDPPVGEPLITRRDRANQDFIKAMKDLGLAESAAYQWAIDADDDADPSVVQKLHQLSMALIGREIARIVIAWRPLAPDAMPSDDERASDCPPLPGLSPMKDALGEVEDANGVLIYLLEFWIVQLATGAAQGIEWEQKIKLVQISGDIPNRVAPRFRTAADKLAGVQLAHFGAFYKQSWRVNDWMWGRLDGVDRMRHVVAELAGGDPADDTVIDQVRELQLGILTEEIPRLSSSIKSSHFDDGSAYTPEERRFVRSVDEAGEPPGVDDLGPLLAKTPSTKLGNEIESDMFVRTVTHTAAVGSSSLAGKQGGMGKLRHLFGQMRNLVLLPFYVLGRGATTSARVVGALTLASLLLALTFITIHLALKDTSLPSSLLAVSWVVVVFWALFSIARVSTPGRVALAILGLLPLVVLASAYTIDWVSDGVEPPGKLVCSAPLGDDSLTINRGTVSIAVGNCEASMQTTPLDPELLLTNAAWVGLISALSVHVATMTLGRPLVFLASFAMAILVFLWWLPPILALEGRPDIHGWPVVGALTVFALLILVVPVWTNQESGQARKRVAGGLGIGTALTVVLVGSVKLAGDRLDWVDTSVVWILENPTWATVAAIVLPTALGALFTGILRDFRRPAQSESLPNTIGIR